MQPRTEDTKVAKIEILREEADFILKEHTARKFGDREFYGPGAAEANERRNRRLQVMGFLPTETKRKHD